MTKHHSFFTKGEVSTLILFGVLGIIAAGVLVTSTLTQKQQNTSSYAAGASGCPYDSGQSISLGGTETDASNAENRVPISTSRYYYDSLANNSDYQRVSDEQILTLSKSDSGRVDPGVRNMMGSMFGFKPKRLAGAYKLSRETGGSDAHVLEVPVNAVFDRVKVPDTGYDIGGGYEAMVTFASEDRVTIHIGRHEYFTGTKSCANGQRCSGGYWIYVKGICVDRKILDAYNQVKDAQERAGANLDQIQLPMVRPGHVLGRATGDSVLVAVRDNGPFISIFKPDYWGAVPVMDMNVDGGAGTQNTTPTPTSIRDLGGGAPRPTTPPTNTPRPTSTPTRTPTPLPTTATGPGTPTSTPRPTATNTPVPLPTTAPTVEAQVTPPPTGTPANKIQNSIGALIPLAPQGPTPVPTQIPSVTFNTTINIIVGSNCNQFVGEDTGSTNINFAICPEGP